MLLLTGNGFHKKISAINLKNITCRRYDRSSADNFARTDPKMINCLLSADIMSKAFSCRLLMRKSHVFRSDQLLISVLVIASIKDLCKPNQESGATSREDLTTAQNKEEQATQTLHGTTLTPRSVSQVVIHSTRPECPNKSIHWNLGF